MMKGVFAGMVVGAPFPIAGTAAGALVLSICGLDALRNQLLSTRVVPSTEKLIADVKTGGGEADNDT